MDSSKIACLKKELENVIKTVSSQKQEILKLNKKLESLVCERDSLLNERDKFYQWKEKIDGEHTKLFAELSNTCKVQAGVQKKCAIADFSWKIKFSELQNVNCCMTDRLETLESNENKLRCKLAACVEKTKCDEIELCSIKSKFKEKNCLADKLKTDLKCNEDELCRVHRLHDELTKEYSVLNIEKMNLEMNLNCTKSELNDIKLSASHAEEKFKIERETLSNKLSMKYKRLKCMEIRYEEANRKLNEEKCNVKNAMKSLMELKDTFMRQHDKMKNEVKKLNEDNCKKENDLCHLKKKIKQLQYDIECNRDQSNGQIIKLREKYDYLKPTKRSSDREVETILENQVNIDASITSGLENEVEEQANISILSKNLKMNACSISDKFNIIIQKYTTKSNKDSVEKHKVQSELDNMTKEVGKIYKSLKTV